MVPRSVLAPLVPDLEAAATHLVTRTNDALRLLRLYLMAWRDTFNVTDPAICRLSVTHVHDLMAMALGAIAVANGRGIRGKTEGGQSRHRRQSDGA
ncbi:MAG: hypothetical protein ACREDO_01410 [Methyloceanibacter sp.]